MPDRSSIESGESAHADGFGPTSWTLVYAARDADMPQRKEALEQLCGIYWYPLYAYVRRHRLCPEDAEDITQSFFQHLLERNFLGVIDRRKGKFRSFLLVSLKYFMENERQYRNAAKRGGGKIILSLEQCLEDRFAAEPATQLAPELQFDRDWAQALMERARRRLREEYAEAGKSNVFDHLEKYLAQESTMADYKTLATRLNMTANAVAIAASRLRRRYRDLLQEEINRTVSSPDEAAREMQYLLEVLGTRYETFP